jgi:hypothetical protein
MGYFERTITDDTEVGGAASFLDEKQPSAI